MTRLGIVLSGRGSNFEAIAEQIGQGRLPAEIAVVVANRADAPGLDAARRRGLLAVALSSRGVERPEYDRSLIEVLRGYDVEWVILAGYMRILTADFIRAFPERILNIHPSLLPSFPGLDAQHQAFAYGVQVTGCTVHFVDEHLDHGPIVMQATVEVEAGDTVETLSERILRQEHRIYSEALRLLLAGGWQIEGRKVIGLRG